MNFPAASTIAAHRSSHMRGIFGAKQNCHSRQITNLNQCKAGDVVKAFQMTKLQKGMAMAALPLALVSCNSNDSKSSTSSSTSAKSTTTKTAQLFAQCLENKTAGDNEEATTCFNQVIKDNPNDEGKLTTYANYNLGVIAQEAGDVTSAIQFYNRTLALSPSYQSAQFNIAVALTPDQPEQALEYYNKILAVNPDDANALFNAGLIEYLNPANVEAGKEMIRKAIGIAPSLELKIPAGVVIG